jgi:hypothetical protein
MSDFTSTLASLLGSAESLMVGRTQTHGGRRSKYNTLVRRVRRVKENYLVGHSYTLTLIREEYSVWKPTYG